jgi:hypothetical protein
MKFNQLEKKYRLLAKYNLDYKYHQYFGEDKNIKINILLMKLIKMFIVGVNMKMIHQLDLIKVEKYMIELFLNAPIELKAIISFSVLSIIWSLNRHN